jgi:hypothetical protein
MADNRPPTLEDRVARSPRTVDERTPEELLVLDLDSGRYFGLSRVGEVIWRQLDGQQDLAAVAHHVATRFGIDVEQARDDVLDFVAQLVVREIAVVVARAELSGEP